MQYDFACTRDLAVAGERATGGAMMAVTIEKESRARPDMEALAAELLGRIEQARSDARDDPFGNPVLRVTLWLTRLMDRGELTVDGAGELVRRLGRQALRQRAGRVARYVGLDKDEAPVFAALAQEAAEEAASFDAFRQAVERVRFAAVFTAHPTFGMARRLCHALADLASGGSAGEAVVGEADLSFRPDGRITLQDEFEQARYAVRHARDAVDRLNAAFFAVARDRWPERWTELVPTGAPISAGGTRCAIGWNRRADNSRASSKSCRPQRPQRPFGSW